MVSYTTLLDSLAKTIERISTSGYNYDESDAWHRGRTVAPSEEPTGHLEFWIVLGPAGLSGSGGLRYQSATVAAWVRTVSDDTATAEGRIHDAAIACMAALSTWRYDSQGARTTPRGYSIPYSDGEWAQLVVDLTLDIGSWRT